MKTKWKILIAVLALGLALTGFFVLSKPENSSKPENPVGDENMPVSTALPIFYSGSTVNSEEEALAVFNQHVETTKESTMEKLSQSQKSQDAEIIGDMIFFNDYATVERRDWRNDQYWLGPAKSAYVVVTPAASKYENWSEKEGKILVERTRLQGENITLLPTNITTYEEMKKYLNQNYPGKTETYWTETKLWIKYLVDDNGTIYWAGQYLVSKPWLDY